MKIFVIFGILISLTAAADLRIFGGKKAKCGQFPYQISIRTLKKFKCGGSILNERWILTAAHCVVGYKPAMLRVFAGSNNRTGGKKYEIEKIYSHENYSRSHKHNDIALIKVARDIKFNKKIHPIELYTDYLEAGKEFIFSGWGMTQVYPEYIRPEKLQCMKLKSNSYSDCNKRISELTPLDETQICSLTKAGKGACKGDSGGPLVYEEKVAGIFSLFLLRVTNNVNVFTRVSSYVDWIYSHMLKY